jgi:hypothetical protein
VEKAADAGELREMEAPMALPTMVAPGEGGAPIEVAQLIKYVGSKTFVFRDGVWIDTAYDPSAMGAVEVGFMSDDYLDLVAAVPALGDYFALGERVIAVHDGAAYETVSGPGEAISIPADPDATSVAPPAAPDGSSTVVPVDQPASDDDEGGTGLCAGAAALPLVLAGAVVLVGRRRQS